jgi:hypothetical protein
VDPDRLDLDELGLMLAQPFKSQVVLHMLNGVEPAAAVAFLQFMAARREPSVEAILDSCEQGTSGMRQMAALQDKAIEARAKQT